MSCILRRLHEMDCCKVYFAVGDTAHESVRWELFQMKVTNSSAVSLDAWIELLFQYVPTRQAQFGTTHGCIPSQIVFCLLSTLKVCRASSC